MGNGEWGVRSDVSGYSSFPTGIESSWTVPDQRPARYRRALPRLPLRLSRFWSPRKSSALPCRPAGGSLFLWVTAFGFLAAYELLWTLFKLLKIR